MFSYAKIGELKLDRVLFESYYPILFTCINENKELFLCVCFKADKISQKWLVTNVNSETVIEMLQDRRTIRNTFKKNNGKKFTVEYIISENKYYYIENDRNDWDFDNSDNLPTSGEYMDVDDDEFSDDILYYMNFDSNNSNDFSTYSNFNIKFASVEKVKNRKLFDRKVIRKINEDNMDFEFLRNEYFKMDLNRVIPLDNQVAKLINNEIDVYKKESEKKHANFSCKNVPYELLYV